jgi:hypothetical protein
VDVLMTLMSAVAQDGWVTAMCDLDSFRRQAAVLGWTEVAPRRGDPTTSTLRPTSVSAAPTRSLSASYGLAAQPLHTDGAHLPAPPDVVVIACDQPSATPTRLWRSTSVWPPHALSPVALSHGMFLVRNGRDSFFAPALSKRRYRFDPGCMSPCDARAQEVAGYFAEALQDAATHEWSVSGQLLVLDNRRTLHARSAVADGDENRVLTRIAFRTGQVQ